MCLMCHCSVAAVRLNGGEEPEIDLGSYETVTVHGIALIHGNDVSPTGISYW